jgi:signal transduction histidine kinase
MSSGPERPDTATMAVAVAVAAVAAIGLVDYLTGPMLSLSVFYLVPTAWVTVQAGRKAGLVVAGLSGAAAVGADVLTQVHYTHRVVAAWNAVLMLITLVVVVELIHRVRRQALAALDAERRSREFLASAAHQLRTPLAGIRSTVDALMLGEGVESGSGGDTDGEQEQLLLNLNREASRAGRQISSLLRVARLDQHEPVPFRTAAVADVVAAEVERAAAAGSALTWDVDTGGTPITCRCNPDAIGEALANLFDNARRHARQRVLVQVCATDDCVDIVVRDDGGGLPAGATEAAFQRFVSLDGQGGTGLGLPIARGIAEAHGGTLAYLGGGFVLSLPRG